MNPSPELTSADGPSKSHTVLHHVKPETPEVANSARMCLSREAPVRLPTIRVTYLFICVVFCSCRAPASHLNNDMIASQRQDCRLVIIQDLPQYGFGMLTEKRRCNRLNHRRASEFQR